VPPTLRCLVADDHPAVGQAVSDYLAAHGLEVAGVVRDGAAALAAIEAGQPDVAVLDVQMPGLTGIELARATPRVSPATAVILYTAHGDRALLADALDAGARGFVLKEAPLEELLRAVRLVGEGRSYVDPVLAGVLTGAAAEAPGLRLTPRERDTLRLLADGLSNEEIGRELFISAETVRTHLRKAMEKLGAETRTQAVATALRQSLIS
jgi:DNA-binding NarL/FixJ family response regulator